MQAPADTDATHAVAILGHVPSPPTGEKKPRMQFRARGGEAVAVSSAARPIGIHEAAFFVAAAEELPVNAAVLHSVVHAHKSFPVATTESAAEEEMRRPKEDLQIELDRIAQQLSVWSEERASKERERFSTATSPTSVEREMEKRIFGKRAQEQDRALRRMSELVETMESLNSRCIESFSHITPSSKSSSTALDEAEKLAKQEAELRQCMSASKWLVEKHLRGKREARLACEREFLLGSQLIVREEEMARIALLALKLNARAQGLFAEDEAFFRAAVLQQEWDAREALTGEMPLALSSQAAAATVLLAPTEAVLCGDETFSEEERGSLQEREAVHCEQSASDLSDDES